MTEDSKVVKSIFTGGAIIFGGYIISKIFGLFYRIIVGRYLGPEAYGIISVMIAVFSVAATIGYLGVPQGVQKYVAEYRSKENINSQIGAIRIGLLLVTLSTVLTGIALFLLAPWLATEVFNDSRTVWPIRLVALILPLRGFRKIGNAVTDGYERMEYKAYSTKIYPNVAKVIFTAAFILLGYNYMGAAVAFAMAYGSAFLLAGYYAYRMVPETFDLNIKGKYHTKKLFNHSWPLFAAGLLASIAGYIDTFMLQSFLGSREVGLYNAAYPFAALLTFGTSLFGSIYLSNASKLYSNGDTSQMKSSYRMVVKWISLVSLPLFSIMVLYPVSLLQIFGAEYLEMGNVLRVLSVGFLASALIGPMSKTLQAIEKTKYKLYITIFTGISNIGLNYLLIPIYGVMGAALATAGTFILAFLIKTLILYRLIELQPIRFSVVKISLAAAISGLLTYLIAGLLFTQIPYWFIIPATILFGLIYLPSIILLKAVEDEDLEVISYLGEKTNIKTNKLEKILKQHIN